MPTRFPDPSRHPYRANADQRVVTRGLAIALIALALLLALSLRNRFPRPDLATAIEMLADGDLDGKERHRMLRITVDGGLGGSTVADRWAGMLAAIALDDSTSYDRLRARLGTGAVPESAPPQPQRRWLDLGDPLLANLAAALIAEIDGARDLARTKWRQVANQCQLHPNPLAARLAAQALQRLA